MEFTKTLKLFVFAGLSLWAQLSLAGGCDCFSACSVQSAEQIQKNLCSFEDARRCGGELNPRLGSRLQSTQNSRAQEFINAMANQRSEILGLYGDSITDEKYTQLSILAFAILGNESSFYEGWKYKLKANSWDFIIHMSKCVRRKQCKGSELSRGPTQMKTNVIPQRIMDHFGVTSNSIYTNPAHAAAATMGFLIELSDQLTLKKREYPIELAGLNDQTLIDYLPYFYQGKGRRILKGGETPDPEKNGYLKAVHKHVSEMYGQQLFCNIAVARQRTDSVTGSIR